MKNFTKPRGSVAAFYLLLFVLLMVQSVNGYATAWTTTAAGPVTTLTNWTNGSTAPTNFTTPGDTWTVVHAMTLPSGSTWTTGTAASTPVAVIIAAGGRISLSGTVPSGTLNVYGDLTISGGTLFFSATSGTITINVYGNYSLSSGNVRASGNSPVMDMTIYGNYTMSGGTDTMTGNGPQRIMNLHGNHVMSGGSIYFSATSGNFTMRTYGNFDMSGGTAYLQGNTANFIDTVYGNCTITGTSGMINSSFGTNSFYMAVPSASGIMSMMNISTGVWAKTNFYVNAGCVAQLAGNFGATTGVIVNGRLICPAPFSVCGTGAFTVNTGATLEIANAAGINGNITTSGTKTLAPGGNYVFNGVVPQVTGTLLPLSLLSPDTITINNSAGVTLSKNASTTGTLLFLSGTLHTGTFTMTTPGAVGGVVGANATSYVDGALAKTITGVTVVDYEVGNIDYAPMNLALSGAGTAGTLGVRCTNGLHPNVGTSGMLTTNIVNHYWTIINGAAAGPFQVTPSATYNFGDIIGGSNISFSTQKYAAGTWLGAALATTNTAAPYTSGVGAPLILGTLAGDYIFGNACASPITGTSNICAAGGTTTLANVMPGGTWSSSDPLVATVSPTGVVTGVSAGATVIIYATASCSASMVITVDQPAITGVTTLCPASTTTLSNALPGGVWTSSNPSVATVSATGVVYGVSGGTTNISYAVGACPPTSIVVTVTTLVATTGNHDLCTGGTNTLTNGTPGGVWSSDNTSVATVTASGVVTGVSVGTATISYTLSGCSTGFLVTDATMTPITGVTTLCAGRTTSLSDGAAWAGGTWSSSNTAVATVSATGSVGTAYAASAATVVISHTYGSCVEVATVTVNANDPITGPTLVCVGATIALSNAVAGGTWSSSNTSRATVGVAGGVGYVTGVSSATPSPVISYILPTGCTETLTISVVSSAAITGPTVVCTGATIALNGGSSGGTWSSTNTGIATVSNTGVVSGITAGIVDISYTVGTCGSAGRTITVNTGAGSITGPSSVCVGSTITLSNATAGGTWSSNNPGKASVGAGTGIVTGVSSAAPAPVISYVMPGGCAATRTITVTSTSAITGVTNICESGGTVTLNGTPAGGTWASGSPGVATVNLTGGVVTGLSAGIANITYSTAAGCGAATTMITVDPMPAAITGVVPICMGSTITLANATSGGLWSSSPTSVATIGATGIVYGVSSGNATIAYTVASCATTATVTINAPQIPQICVVDVDVTTGKNLVVWEQFVSNRVSKFYIYRQNSSSVFVKIDSQAKSVFSTYLDAGSNPVLQSYSYQITALDSCGNESPLASSTVHTTIHLSANLGVGGVVNLIWNTYVGKTATTQDVMRSVAGGPFVNIASVANTITSYTDPTPPSGAVVYKINSVMPIGCFPSTKTSAYTYISSNPVEISVVGVNTIGVMRGLEIYPNPASASLTIAATENITSIVVTNLLGQIVYERSCDTLQATISISELPAGIYLVKINNSEVRKFMKE